MLGKVLESEESTDISAERVRGGEGGGLRGTNEKLTSEPLGKESPMEYYERMKAEKAAKRTAKREARRARMEEGGEEDEEEEEEGGKRAITYQVCVCVNASCRGYMSHAIMYLTTTVWALCELELYCYIFGQKYDTVDQLVVRLLS